MTTKDWREFTLTFSGMCYLNLLGVCFVCAQFEAAKSMSSYFWHPRDLVV